ncbi:gamma-glutamylcyclotransferase [Novosphingobium profundi]|uniref:gamma-glutamylcyclotransferase family protein n=1 Tax=Novosphingobium profundi TaxID=1774954 RepID=UPI001BD91ACC|nr:gamma-glutamylcyclotransferase family protein [Novosphingobium profundi]MBT0667744.1 gamma-glutamylcyclotransferase [Novosphingobium profundi]
MIAPRRFFFYGTLLDEADNPIARAAHRHLRPIGRAWVPGALVALPDPAGWYPALVRGEGRVAGVLYAALPGFGANELAALDHYEGCALGEYWRAIVPAHDGAGRARAAQAYLYRRRPPRAAQAIASGDFSGWLTETGRGPFRAG